MAQNTVKNPWLAAEAEQAGGTTAGPATGGSAIQKQQPGKAEHKLYFYHPDHLGSTGYVTDEFGAVYQHLQYFPFGETWTEEASNTDRIPYLFTGKELDEETGLYYFGARYYDPRASLWVSVDPILEQYLPSASSWLKAAEEGHIYYPEKELPGMGGVMRAVNLNLYQYVSHNPVKFVDPDGNAMFENGEELLAAGTDVTVNDATVQPGYGGARSWCNRLVGLIEERGGNSTDYANTTTGQHLRANDIIAKLQDTDFATEITGEQAAAYSSYGATVIAAMPSTTGSGHVATVAPLPMVYSGNWGKKVPQIFNAGPNGTAIQGANYGFGNEPKYYIKNDDLSKVQAKQLMDKYISDFFNQ